MEASQTPHGQANGVLIVDDEPEILMLLSLIFETEQFTVYRATDGLAALDLFSAHADDVVLMITDLGLPKLGGIELIEKIRAKKPSMKIIGSSGYSRANVAEEVLKAGGDAFAPKPYLVADLLRTVRQLLGRS